jgi:hypothetical protein
MGAPPEASSGRGAPSHNQRGRAAAEAAGGRLIAHVESEPQPDRVEAEGLDAPELCGKVLVDAVPGAVRAVKI